MVVPPQAHGSAGEEILRIAATAAATLVAAAASTAVALADG